MADTEQDESAEISGEDIFEEATAPEPKARDERGRFAKQEAEEAEAEAEETEASEQAEPEKHVDHRIPLTELLNEREKRQEAARQVEAYRRELEQLRQQLQPQRQPQPIPDQFADPEGYNAHWERKIAEQQYVFENRLREHESNLSLRLAHQTYGKDFEEAYNAVMEAANRGDRGPAQTVVNSADPGTTMVNWYKREQTLKTVGNDPQAYTERVLEEALNNPEFLAKALEKAKGVAAAQPTQVKLPPSLNKATSAGRADDHDGTSDMAIYRHAIGR